MRLARKVSRMTDQRCPECLTRADAELAERLAIENESLRAEVDDLDDKLEAVRRAHQRLARAHNALALRSSAAEAERDRLRAVQSSGPSREG